MIRVLIVDDDKLVRKGLASSMPWAEFGMEVVGEANNGENALAFMEMEAVDLVMTDLSMPVMSGIELMRVIRDKYDHVHIVVLSLHQDFEYVQEALRLGAIDYIAKVQLEREQFEEVLGRVVRLMGQKGTSRAADPQQSWQLKNGELYVYYALNLHGESESSEAASAEAEGEQGAGVPAVAAEAGPGVWYTTQPPAAGTALPAATALVRFYGLEGMERREVLQAIRGYGKSELFYAYDPRSPFIDTNIADLARRERGGKAPSLERIRERWTGADWLYEDDAFQAMRQQLKDLRLPPVRLARMFYSLSDEWNRLYQSMLRQPIAIDDFFGSWSRFALWLGEVRGQIRQANAKPLFSQEIETSIVKAIHLAQGHIHDPIPSSEIAHLVNMSGSYFSQCFKQYTGQTYTDYVRHIRMERAREYLCNTTKTIGWVAEQIGYVDEKYFSRLFRDHTGYLPSEYRLLPEGIRSSKP